MPPVLGAKELKQRLAAHPAGVYFFFGEEEHLKRVYLSRFKALVRENAEFNTAALTLKEGEGLGGLAAELGAVPFLSPLRFVGVWGLELHKLSEKESEEFCRLISACGEDQIVIFYFYECDLPFSGNIPRTAKRLNTLPVYKNLPENAVVVNFTHPTPAELYAYYEAKFAHRNVKAAPEVVRLFCARGAGDMTLLENESEKLIAYAASHAGEITREMVDEALPETDESMLYKISDAVENADVSRALNEYRILRGMKFDPIPILATLARCVSTLHLAAACPSVQTLVEAHGIKDFRAKKLVGTAKKYTKKALREAQELCLGADKTLKNTSLDPDVVLQECIVRICRTLKGEQT